jgi:hypothetical protein
MLAPTSITASLGRGVKKEKPQIHNYQEVLQHCLDL